MVLSPRPPTDSPARCPGRTAASGAPRWSRPPAIRQGLAASVAALDVVTVGQRPPVSPGAQIVEEDVEAAPVIGRRIVSRGVRADDQVRCGPQPMAVWDRLRR